MKTVCDCKACKMVRATQRIVMAECRPVGKGVDDRTVEMWNKVLADNPCEREIEAMTEAGYDRYAMGGV